MAQPVYDLLFGSSNVALSAHPRGLENAQSPKLARPDAKLAGHAGGHGPAIPTDAWPRSPSTGFPMVHVVTFELPPEYRRKGPDLVGLSLFQADDHVAKPTPGAKEALTTGLSSESSQFFASLVRAHGARHPETCDLTDIIGGNFVAIWLRDHELRGPRTAPPSDDRGSAPAVETGQKLNAWDHTKPEVLVWMAERSFDPNAGKAPVEVYGDEDAPPTPYVPSDEYVDVVLTPVETLKAFYEEHHGRSHLGGTCLAVQSMPEGLTPWFLELEDEIGGANFGGGNLQYDLESGVFDWAC